MRRNRQNFGTWVFEEPIARRARVLLLLTGVLAVSVFADAQVTFAGSQVGLASGTWSAPTGAAADGKGNLYIADSGNNRVMELSPSSTGFSAPVTVLSGLSGPAGVAADWNGNVFVSDTGNNRVVMLPVTSGGFGPAVTVAGGLNAPMGLAVDSADNLYIADSGNNRVVEIPLVLGTYLAPVVVGAGFDNPMGVAVDAARNLFIADTGHNRIVKEAFTAGRYPTQQFDWTNYFTPAAIAVDKNDNLCIADSKGKRVLQAPWYGAVGRFGGLVVIGSGFASPAGVATDPSGNVYVADSENNQVMKVVTSAIQFGAVSVGSGVAPLTYNFSVAAGTTVGSVSIDTQGVSGKDFVDAGGSTCLAETYSSTSNCGVSVNFNPLASGTRMGAVELFDAYGNALATAFISGVGEEAQIAFLPGTETMLGTQLSGPAGVAVDGSGNVYISDTGNNRVVELAWTGSGYGPQTTLPLAGVISPMGLTVDGAGNLYIVCNGNDKVLRLPWTGNGFGTPTKVGTGLYGPSEVSADARGNVYITDTLDGRIDKLPWTGSGFEPEQTLGNYPKNAVGLAVDGGGNVYFTDPYQSRVSEVPWSGSQYETQIVVLLNGAFFPSALAVDGNSNLYVLDTANNRVILLPWTGSGFGQQITVASGFNAPSGLAIDGIGNLYVADTGNNQVVKIDLTRPGTMSFLNTYLGATSADSARVTLALNTGNQPLLLTSVSYPADFPESSGDASACAENTSLVPSEWCQLAVNFTPLTVGSPLTEAVVITDNSLGMAGTQQSIAATGTSVANSAQSISFPSVPGTVYGAAPIPLAATASSGLPITYRVISGPGILDHSGQMLSFSGIGSVVVQATQAGNSAFAAANPVTASIHVAPATLTVTPGNVTAVYGSIPTSFHYAITGFAPGENAATVVTGQATVACAASGRAGAGNYQLTVTQSSLSAANYVFVLGAGTLRVNQALLQIVARPYSHTYGTPMGTLGWYMWGFVNGDTASAVSGVPVLTTSANSGSPVGSYPILVSVTALAASNYYFQGDRNVLTVIPAVLTVRGTNQSMTYGGTIPALSYWISGFMNGDSAGALRGSATVATSATIGSSAGTYPISPSQGTLAAGNYTFRFVAGVLSIQRAVLMVNPGNVSMSYGAQLPAYVYSMSGFVNGDTQAAAVGGAPALTSLGNSRSAPGSFAILAGPGSLVAKNYKFAFGGGVLTIGKTALTVTAMPASMTYGASLPNLTYSYSGFVNGDGSASLVGAPLLTTGAKKTSPAGTYRIACAMGTLASQKYTFKVVSGSLTVSQAVIAVQAASLSMTYGGALPSASYRLTGFVNGDSSAVVSGVPSVTNSATQAVPAGVYPISVAMGSLSAANYKFNLGNGSITVNKAPLTVSAKSLSIPVGSAAPVLSYSVNGFVNGDTLASSTTGTPSVSISAASLKAGTYAIVAAAGNLSAKNYSFTFVNGILTVTK